MPRNDDNGNDRDDDSPLKPFELKQLRRMLRDDEYARRARLTRRVWLVAAGSAASMIVAGLSAWRETIGRLFK